jgi:2-polyprenyl-6-hydroxyphenyl methylase/3-demethylubiquinone-9 3-methyltransferase
MLILATLNRTIKSYLLAIVGAEYVLRWLEPGTHDWTKFLTPAEISHYLRTNTLELQDMTGLSLNPLSGTWGLSQDIKVNYMVYATKR